jgi:hypothetical protein
VRIKGLALKTERPYVSLDVVFEFTAFEPIRLIPKIPIHFSAGILPVEGKRWMLTLAGRYDEKPPGDRDGWLMFAQQLRTPTFYNAIRHAKPVSEIARFVFKGSCWRHFGRLEKLPKGQLPFGDVICRFNPIYGQGMSVAALEAEALARLLAAQSAESDGLAGLAAAFFAKAERLIDTPWWTAAIPDFIDPRADGNVLRTSKTRSVSLPRS